MNNIVLIGFMGSGKGTIGRLLARKTERFFLDTDALIEDYARRSISEIFANEGEEAFREMERFLATWIAKSVDNVVLAAGGGLPIVCDNLREIGEVIYLKCDFETIAARLSSQSERAKRPLAQSTESLRKLFILREPIYAKIADRTIDATQNINAVVKAIL
ncbi:MAG: shikimate kinase [Helicobacteraceae bacterium]|nr:shikimate kinase [Helicobacteraceae bacterium]